MNEAKVSKGDLPAVIDRLKNQQTSAIMNIQRAVAGAPVNETNLTFSFRDVYLKLQQLYTISNDVSLGLNTITSVLSYEIKALEDEIDSMQKTIDNFSFGLSDGGSFDYLFIETFNDQIMDDTINNVLIDRTSTMFNQDEIASVNTATGTLSMISSLNQEYNLSASIKQSNCLGRATSNTGPNRSLNSDVATGWRVAISSPNVITSTLDDRFEGGAQVELEIFLSNPSPCDTLELVPFTDTPVDILSIKLFADVNLNTFIEIINEPITLDKPTNLYFPLQNVYKFNILLNQTTYKRGTVQPDYHETQYRDFVTQIDKDKKAYELIKGSKYTRNKKVYQYVFLKSEKPTFKFPAIFHSMIPTIDFDTRSGPMTLDKILFKRKSPSGDKMLWQNQQLSNHILKDLIYQHAFPGNYNVLSNRTMITKPNSWGRRRPNLYNDNGISGRSQSYPNWTAIEPPQDIQSIISQSTTDEALLNYEYDLGLRNIHIGTGISTFKNVYISKSIPAPGDSGEVRMKIKDTNYNLSDTSKDLSRVTSIEYSITNVSAPKLEIDWIPIIPSNENNEITGERFFINEAGVGYFRFPASVTGTAVLYKNGYNFDFGGQLSYIYSNNRQTIIGIRIPLNSYGLSDFFTCSYTAAGDPTTINFESIGAAHNAIASASDNLGAGQTFASTNEDRVITLAYQPYIDHNAFSDASYEINGNGFINSYQPIVILFADGSIAFNQTNYIGEVQNSIADYIDDDDYHFIQSGNRIIFNKVIDKTFTIFYQYLPSNLKFRVVLRINSLDIVSPSVDYVQLKTKIKNSDSRKTL